MIARRSMLPVVLFLLAGTGMAMGQTEAALSENFLALMKSSWKDIGLLATGIIFKVVIGGIIGFIVGLILGILLYIIFLRKRWLDAPFPWYRYVKWIWAPTFIVSMLVAGSIIGIALGLNTGVNAAVKEDRAVRKTFANLTTAFALGYAEVEMTGKEKPTEVVALIKNSKLENTDNINELMEKSREALNKQWEKRKGNPFGIPLMVSLISDIESHKVVADDLLSHDVRDVLSVLYLDAVDPPGYKKHLAENPNLKPLGISVRAFLNNIEEEALAEFKLFVFSNAFLNLLFGFAIPIGLALVFRIVVRSVGTPRRPAPA